ncbi:YdcF family protein [Comamonas composti]|uniref:YdcF family protein n=1 Tax=Comamonas composti TaxID=408558 RepID=UPI000403CD44|nr:YdcF family protein [Comamonas composti]
MSLITSPRPGLHALGLRQWLGLIAGLVLLLDALVLMAYGMFNLGVTLPAALGLLLVVSSLGHRAIAGWLDKRPAWRRAWRLSWLGLGLWLLSLLLFWGFLLLHIDRGWDDGAPVQAVLVLGSATRDGQPSTTLAQRLDVAAAVAERQPQALVLVSGGVDFGEKESEAAVMARYLIERHGLAQDRLLLEQASTSTALNLALSLPLLQQRGLAADAPMALVTSDFHTLRALWIARRNGYVHVRALGAPTPLSIRANAWLREYFAVLSGWLLGEF